MEIQFKTYLEKGQQGAGVAVIPKVIHYCWFGGKPLTHDAKKCIRSWEKYCPDYTIIRWDESNFDVMAHPFTEQAYRARKWAFVSDFARLKIIYDNGGIYLDTDVELIKNLDVLLTNTCYMGIAQCGDINTGLGFGAMRHHEMIKEMLGQYHSFDAENPVTCPVRDTKLFKKYGYCYVATEQKIEEINGVTLYPARYFSPFAPGNSANLLCDETFSIHHYSASWTSAPARCRRKVITTIGVEKVQRVKELIRDMRRRMN